MSIHSAQGRDAGLRRASRLTRWIAFGSAGLTGLLAVVVAGNAPGAKSDTAAAQTPTTVETNPPATTQPPSDDYQYSYGDDSSRYAPQTTTPETLPSQTSPRYQSVQPVQPAPTRSVHVRSGGS